ncbi:hypothetical protein MGYG_08045 [Nannizzia gypsea CBS 118893]|uniref:Cytochrome P450 n=1 Tax=Arthroderma gypseum (strain ATCC MYA-4604 / CBS 118893) TaxID=535722 RepID=E4V4W6_ARTGP|nr:hypothetical protein MGYG_08045 [Nannizzia gypsea CBS 118893]EFR05040.1 hypothetical protein MGYG_08045 [Nannizzia gypsea CBS 118893]
MGAQVWLVVAAIGTICHFLFGYLSPKYDPREPKPLSQTIPLIGHAIGMARHGLGYCTALRDVPSPIFSMSMLNKKFYVVTSATLVSAIQRSAKFISFEPFLNDVGDRLAGIKGDGLKLLQEPTKSGGSLSTAMVHAMATAISGSGLDKMNAIMINFLQASMDELATATEDPIDLFAWGRDAMTTASSEAVWGAKNPLRRKEVQDMFWEYELNLTMLYVNILPQLTAQKSYRAREELVKEFIKFYEVNGQWEASELSLVRWKIQHEAGANIENIARMEATLCIGVLSNTVPSLFWLTFDIFSRPELLEKLRQEVWENAVHPSVDSEGNTVHSLDVADIRNKCTLLLATFQEMLRIRSNSATIRTVLEDVEVNNQYLLKKGSMLLLPAQFLNLEGSTWGSDSADFNPYRFIDGDREKGGRLRSKGYMSWGTSPNMCPGRHFASGEILPAVAMLLVRYDITPVDGTWHQPSINREAVAASIPPPKERFLVKFSTRESQDAVKWEFRPSQEHGRYKLVTG